jgi:hypothetical protein
MRGEPERVQHVVGARKHVATDPAEDLKHPPGTIGRSKNSRRFCHCSFASLLSTG